MNALMKFFRARTTGLFLELAAWVGLIAWTASCSMAIGQEGLLLKEFNPKSMLSVSFGRTL